MKWLIAETPGAKAVRHAITALIAAVLANVPLAGEVASLVSKLFGL